MELTCTVEDDQGGLSLLLPGSGIVEPIVADGSIRCHDVPYVNW